MLLLRGEKCILTQLYQRTRVPQSQIESSLRTAYFGWGAKCLTTIVCYFIDRTTSSTFRFRWHLLVQIQEAKHNQFALRPENQHSGYGSKLSFG